MTTLPILLGLAVLLAVAAAVPPIPPRPDIDAPMILANLSFITSQEWVNVRWEGVQVADRDSCWIGVFSPADAAVNAIVPPISETTTPPFTATAPIKFINCSEADASFMSTGGGSKNFTLVNMRHGVSFYLFSGGFYRPVAIAASQVIEFSDRNMPMHVHIARTKNITEMMIQWVSQEPTGQVVQFGIKSGVYIGSVDAVSTTYGRYDMCGPPANAEGWFDPGFFMHAVVSVLSPSTLMYYRVGSDLFGWSPEYSFVSAPTPGPDVPVNVVVIADVGATELDACHYHWEEPFADRTYLHAANANGDVVLHIGDLSYATGYETKWELFMTQIEPIAAHVPYMTAQGNHERDWPGTGTEWIGQQDSGGECGLPAQSRFLMPTPSKKQETGWYSFDQGSIHFLIMDTELPCGPGSAQYAFFESDLSKVDRKTTPWVVFGGHRPMYWGNTIDTNFNVFESLLMKYQVDICLWGHVHNAQMTCPVYEGSCVLPAVVGGYDAPIHAVIGNGGQSLTQFPSAMPKWSVYSAYEWGWNQIIAHNSTALEILFYGEGANASDTELHFSHVIQRTYPRD